MSNIYGTNLALIIMGRGIFFQNLKTSRKYVSLKGSSYDGIFLFFPVLPKTEKKSEHYWGGLFCG